MERLLTADTCVRPWTEIIHTPSLCGYEALYGRSSFNSLWLCLHPETPESWMSRERAVDFKQKSKCFSSRWDTSCTSKVLHLPYKITILRAWTSRKFVKGNIFPVYKQKMKTYLATNCNFSNIPDCSTNFKVYLRSDFTEKMAWYKTWIYYAMSN